METQINPATEQMLKAVEKILDCYDYGDGWDEDFVKSIQRRRASNWAERWYKEYLKGDGGLEFEEIGPGYSFATWATKEAMKQVDWVYVSQCITKEVFGAIK